METFAEYAGRKGLTLISWEGDQIALEAVAMFYRLYAAQLATARRGGHEMILDLHFIDTVGFNAFAGSFADADVIAIYRDVPEIVSKVARAMVSHGLILPHIATPNVVVEPIRVPGTFHDLLGAVRVWDVSELADPLREAVARRLSDLVIFCIMSHEFQHLYSGHVDYLQRHLGLSVIAELEGAGLPSPATYERETLEWDADLAASQAVLAAAIEPVIVVVGKGDQSAWVIPDTNIIGTRDDGIVLANIASALSAWFFYASDRGNVLDPKPRKHPHPEFRMTSMLNMIPSALSYRTGIAKAEFEAQAESGYEQFVLTLVETYSIENSNLSDVIPTTAVSPAEIAAAGEARVKIWHETWAKMYPELNKLKRGGRLATPTRERNPAFPDSSTLG